MALLQSLTPDLRDSVIERTETLLSRIVQANFHTQYASKSAILAEFRNAVSSHGLASDTTTLVADFRRHVPLSDYDAYKPFMIAFDKHPCKETELENLFAPGLPDFLVASSATSGKAPKLFPKYYGSSMFRNTVADSERPSALILFYGYNELREVERGPGRVVKRIPVSNATACLTRAMLGWMDIDEDDGRMSTMIPGLVAPWAASMIKNHKSFLMIHALFTLACPNVERLFMTFSTLFHDMIRHVDEEWDMFLFSIRDGTVPDLPGVSKVHSYLQTHVHANPERAAELGKIGPPSSREGWAAHVWPKLGTVRFGCSGQFATVLPKVKLIVGPTIAICSSGYGSSEAIIGPPYQQDDLDMIVLRSRELVEFLEVTTEEYHANILQAWELEVGRQYEPVLTTQDGLWRYRLGDVINVMGFNPVDGAPVFVLSGRRSLSIRLAPMLISDESLAAAIRSISPDILQVSEFTTVLDHRQGAATVGYFAELVGELGPNVHLATSRLTEGLVAAHPKFQIHLKEAQVGSPTIRIVQSGTFTAYRQWRGEKMNIGPGQVKVPAVLIDEASEEWITKCVIREL